MPHFCFFKSLQLRSRACRADIKAQSGASFCRPLASDGLPSPASCDLTIAARRSLAAAHAADICRSSRTALQAVHQTGCRGHLEVRARREGSLSSLGKPKHRRAAGQLRDRTRKQVSAKPEIRTQVLVVAPIGRRITIHHYPPPPLSSPNIHRPHSSFCCAPRSTLRCRCRCCIALAREAPRIPR